MDATTKAWAGLLAADRELRAAESARSPWGPGRMWRPTKRYEAAAEKHRAAQARWDAASAGLTARERNAVTG